VERNREAGQNPPRVVAPSEEKEEEDYSFIDIIDIIVVIKLQVPDHSPMSVFIRCSACIQKSDYVLCQPRGFSHTAVCLCVSCQNDAIRIKYISLVVSYMLIP
jgi:hypothetical protein